MSRVEQQEKRSRLACNPCRRKKIRCPGEKPSCSTCVRVGSICNYVPTARAARAGSTAVEARLAMLEERLNSMSQYSTEFPARSHETARASIEFEPNARDARCADQEHIQSPDSVLSGSTSVLREALQIYSERCHKHPVWLFEPEEFDAENSKAVELNVAILTLASHFSPSKSSDQVQIANARVQVMSQMAHGQVRLSTIEALCLIGQSCLLAGELALARFHISIGLHFCRMASMHIKLRLSSDRTGYERKRRAFWSLQILHSYHGQASARDEPLDRQALEVPAEEVEELSVEPPVDTETEAAHVSDSVDRGIWTVLTELAAVWNRTRSFVSSCFTGAIEEPWLANSAYSQIFAGLTVAESRTPLRHRWQSVRFYDQDHRGAQVNSQYLKPWLGTQFTWHLVLTVLNHPFLYMTAAQRNKKLSVLNTFWTRSSQLSILHATWIIRLTDMVQERRILISDPFVAQAVAIAVTVHLFYLSASDVNIRQRATNDLLKGKRFLEGFKSFSALCSTLDAKLEKLLRAALGDNWTNVQHHPREQVSLNARLVREVLDLACSNCCAATPSVGNGLLDPTIVPDNSSVPSQEQEEVIFEVGGATSPLGFTIDTSVPDGGQSAPIAMRNTSTTPAPRPTASRSYPGMAQPTGLQTLSFDEMVNHTNNSLLWDGHAPIGASIHTFDLQMGPFEGAENATWWDFGDL